MRHSGIDSPKRFAVHARQLAARLMGPEPPAGRAEILQHEQHLGFGSDFSHAPCAAIDFVSNETIMSATTPVILVGTYPVLSLSKPSQA